MNSPALPPIQRLGNAVLLTGTAIHSLRFAARVAIDSRRRNGLPPSDELHQILAATKPLATDRQTASDTELTVDDGDHTDWITTTEAAQIMKCSVRTVTRYAPSIGGVRAGRIWRIHRETLREYQAGKAA